MTKPFVNCRLVTPRRFAAGLIVATFVLLMSGIAATWATGLSQTTFERPDVGVRALMAAAEAGNMPDLLKILGPEATPLVSSGDPIADRQALARFTE